MTRATPSHSASHAAPATARAGVVRPEPEAVALIEALVALLVDHPASARERAVVERAAAYLARARRGGGRP